MGTNTDPYQRAEGRYHLTQGIIGVLSEARNPFSVLTKSPLVLRDLDLLAIAARRTSVDVNLSIGTLDAEVARLTEPGAPHPRRRVTAVARLNDAGVACGVLMGPVLPGLSDGPEQLAETVDAAVAAGARSVSAIYLHLRGPLREHVLGWAAEARPELAERWRQLYGRRANVPARLQAELSAGGRVRRRGPAPPPTAVRAAATGDAAARSGRPASATIAGRRRATRPLGRLVARAPGSGDAAPVRAGRPP